MEAAQSKVEAKKNVFTLKKSEFQRGKNATVWKSENLGENEGKIERRKMERRKKERMELPF